MPRDVQPRIADVDLGGMIHHRDITFRAQRISIDGSVFVDCVFDRCTLVYTGTLGVTFEGCGFNNCEWQFEGPAGNTLAFLGALYRGGARNLVEKTFDSIRGKL